jgi:uncharacterized protein (DUF1499 family)
MAKGSRSARIALVAGVAAALLSLLGPAAAYLRLAPPLTGFLLLAVGLVIGSLLTLLVAAIAIFRSRGGAPTDRKRARIALALGALLLVLLVVLVLPGRGVPPIHDLTTNPEDPPRFVELSADRPYPDGGAQVPQLQREAYPDLAPLRLAVSPEAAIEAAAETATDLGWTVVAQRHDDSVRELEAWTESRLFRFVDDVVVRIRATESGSIVDVRSMSRVGQSDLGANARRIRTFCAGLEERLSQ